MNDDERKEQQRIYQLLRRVSQEHMGLSSPPKPRRNSASSRAHRLDIVLREQEPTKPMDKLEEDLIEIQTDLILRLDALLHTNVITEEEFRASVKRVIRR